MSRAKWVLTAAAVITRPLFAQEIPPPDEPVRPSAYAPGELPAASELAPAAWHARLGEPSDLSCGPDGFGCGDCPGGDGGDPPVRLRFSAPAWLPEVHGEAAVRGVEAPVNVTTRKLFEAADAVNFLFVGRMEAEAGRWGLLADGLYVNLSGDRDFAGERINVSAGFDTAIVDAVVTYDLIGPEAAGDDVSAELLAGGRYWLLGTDGITVTGPRGNSVRRSGRREWVDPVVGGRIAAPLTEDLLMRLRADIGGFGAASDFTWNVEAVTEYRCSECCGLQLGYRVLDVDYSRGGGFAYDVNYRGPVAALVFDF